MFGICNKSPHILNRFYIEFTRSVKYLIPHANYIPDLNTLLNKNSNNCKKCHVRGIRYLKRRPIDVIRHDLKGQKSLEEYVKEAKYQAAEIITDDVEFPKSKKKVEKRRDHNAKEVEKLPSKLHSPAEKSQPHHDCSDSDSEEEELTLEENVLRKALKNLHIKQYKKCPKYIKSFLENGKSSRQRQKDDFFLIEGWRLLGEALQKGLKPKAIFFTRSRLFRNLIPSVASSEEELLGILNMFPLYKIQFSTLKLWSSLTTPPGIAAAISISSASKLCRQEPRENSFPLTVVLDEIRDPNNLGSIIRTVVAAGVRKVILTKGCCDLWDLKTLRAACGTHFSMNCVFHVPWDSISTHLPRTNFPSIFLADFCRWSPEDHGAETDFDKLEELKGLALEETENSTVREVEEDGSEVLVNESYSDLDHLSLYSNIKLPVSHYHDIKFFTRDNDVEEHPIVLIIGGETGLSPCAKKFSLENGGTQVSIPMSNSVESLNSAVATGILIYEAYRQYKNCSTKVNKLEIQSL